MRTQQQIEKIGTKAEAEEMEGVWSFLGNAVHFRDGIAYDIDAAQEVPVDALYAFGDFIRPFDENGD